ncbi:DNA/RNA nuclease SfsA [Petroclostridium xylanilyticum]|uniref:DNA/RNA nuclease SfsA n=1 Tax=Petroclostridium xylanilyticum TaxID=1792311 RepID=UPI000B9938C8|nr:DNA/RNA nuclease SfsA [Petroclostridium xylanilyticum]
MQIEGQLVEGKFRKRLNRFEAIVNIDGVDNLVHVPNTGRLKELLVDDAAVLVRKFNNSNRKTQFGLLLVKKDGVWVSIDSANVPNRIVFEMLKQKKFSQFSEYKQIKKEVSVGNSRFDFGLFSQDKEYYIEVKGVTLVEARKAYFPDAPTARGTKHLEELTQLKLEGKGTGVIFIIQREDADAIMPNDRTDKDFGIALRKACQAGVNLWAYRCIIDSRQIVLDREIPVVLEQWCNVQSV